MNSMDNDDTILLAKACNKSCKKSTERLYIKIKPDIDKYHKSYWSQDIEDSFHELFLQIQERKVHYKGKGNSKTFLNKVIKNIHLEKLNNNKLKFQSLQRMENEGLLPVDENIHTSLKNLEINERNQIISKVISELPPKSRQAIELVYFDGIPAKQAAKLIGCEFRIFRNSLKYAMKKLREKTENCIPI